MKNSVFGLVILLSLSFVGCAQLLGNRTAEKASAIETRDVGASARGEEDAPRHRVLVLPFLDERRGTSQAIPWFRWRTC
jgi:hypothetical protein